MLFMVRFTDKPDGFALRQQHLAAHIAWLDRYQEVVLVGGSLRTEPDAAPLGGLWIVEAHSRAEIMQLMASDPFMLFGLREGVEILHWSKAFSERKTLV
jgi:uncharacterized protein YciI